MNHCAIFIASRASNEANWMGYSVSIAIESSNGVENYKYYNYGTIAWTLEANFGA